MPTIDRPKGNGRSCSFPFGLFVQKILQSKKSMDKAKRIQ